MTGDRTRASSARIITAFTLLPNGTVNLTRLARSGVTFSDEPSKSNDFAIRPGMMPLKVIFWYSSVTPRRLATASMISGV